MKLDKYIDLLRETELFKDVSLENLLNLFKTLHYKIEKYSKSDIIFIEGDECENLGIILEGTIEIQKIDSNGKIMTIATFNPGDVFGEMLIFSEGHKFPMTVVSKVNSTVMHLSKDSVIKICQSQTSFLYSFLRMICNKALILNTKLKEVTLKTIRQQICEFILMQSKKQGSSTIKLNMTKREWADIIGVQRPSLSRELIKMKEEGIIDYEKDIVLIKDMDALNEFI